MPVYTDEGRMQYEGHPTPQVLGLGDSWFWYHVNNLLIPVSQLWAPEKIVLTQGGAGADAVELAEGGKRTAFRRVLRGSPNLQAVLLSAGGNDFAGVTDMFRILVKNGSNAQKGEDCFIASELNALMYIEVLGAYRTLVGDVERLRPEALVFVHNYDYAVPTGIGLFGGMGHWLKEPMDRVGIPAGLQQAAVNHLMDTFSDALVQLQSEYPEHVILVDSTGILGAGDWANELHPTAGGFDKLVAQAWTRPLMDNLPPN